MTKKITILVDNYLESMEILKIVRSMITGMGTHLDCKIVPKNEKGTEKNLDKNSVYIKGSDGIYTIKDPHKILTTLIETKKANAKRFITIEADRKKFNRIFAIVANEVDKSKKIV